MAKVVSCGVIVRRVPGELLLCHATGRNYWDIPKGVRDDGETSVAAALRELHEEACMNCSPKLRSVMPVCINTCPAKTCICSCSTLRNLRSISTHVAVQRITRRVMANARFRKSMRIAGSSAQKCPRYAEKTWRGF